MIEKIHLILFSEVGIILLLFTIWLLCLFNDKSEEANKAVIIILVFFVITALTLIWYIVWL